MILLQSAIVFGVMLLLGIILIQASLIFQWKRRAQEAESKLNPPLLLTQHAVRIDVRV